jgi:predicted ArsR family transcriptional regulator
MGLRSPTSAGEGQAATRSNSSGLPRPRSENHSTVKLANDEQRQAIVAHIRAHGDATIDEIEQATGIDRNSLYWRNRELEQSGEIRRTGKKRKTSRGGPANIFTLTGQKALF